MADEKEVNEFAAESEAAGQQAADDQAVSDVFGGVDGEDAFGIATKSAPSKEAAEEKTVDDKGKEEAEDAKPDANKEAKEKPADSASTAEVKDALLEQLKEKSPVFKELCDKKNFKNVDDAFKTYTELEKLHSKKSNQLSTYKKGLENFVVFDDEGNVTGYTELGKKAAALAKGDAPAVEAAPAKTESGDILSPAETAQLEAIKDKFFDMFEKNPVEAIVRIAMGVTSHNLKGHKDEFSKEFSKIQETLKPILEEREERKMLSLIDDVAKEQIAGGDTKANDFIDEYAPEIEAELKKIDVTLRKSNPKLAIQQAYLKVKDKKVQEWQKSLKEKEAAEQKKAQDEASSDAQGGGGAESEVDPVIQGMEDALKAKAGSGSIFG